MGSLVVKDNALIEASHKLGEAEQRLILLAILEARKECKTVEQLKGKELTIHAESYIQTFGVDRDAAYKALKKAVMGLYRAEWGCKYINRNGNKVVQYERFTQSAKYIEGEGLVSFRFADAIIPMLVELEKRFTVYEIEQVAQLSSSYAMRLYEFFMQHFDKTTGKGWLDISLGDLRFRFGLLPSEYTRMGDFKKGVLDLAIKQINANTDLTASYEQRKKGRTIVGFRFDFRSKQKPAKAAAKPKELEGRDAYTPDLMTGLTDGEMEAVRARIEAHIARLEESGEFVSSFHRTNITKKAIEEGWGLEEYRTQQAQEQARREKQHREALERQREREEEKRKQEEENARRERFSAIWEGMSKQEQESLLDEVEARIGEPFEQFFRKDRKEGEVHTSPMFRFWFYEILGI